MLEVQDRDGTPLPLEAMPGWVALQQNRPVTGQVRFTRLDGEKRLISISAFPFFAQEGEFIGAFVNLWQEEDIQGELVVATVMFCDVRDFTATATELEPARVRDLLNVFYEEMTRIINEHDGATIEYAGDEVFGTWGARRGDVAGPNEAVACARSIQERRAQLVGRLAATGLPAIAYGIGLHTGEVIAAHVGFTSVVVGEDIAVPGLRQFTVIGDTVNCASRLCSIAGRNEIVVSAETYGALDEKPPAESLPGIRLKGVGRDLLPHRLWPEEMRDPTGEERRGKLEIDASWHW